MDQHMVFLVDLKCPNLTRFFENKREENYFRSPFRWILLNSLDDDNNVEVIPSAIVNIDVLPDAEVIIAHQFDNQSFDLYSIYKVSANDSWQSEPYGYWNTKDGLY
ncbi:hypothetical protein ACJJTC_004075 [Scirpophaga incertulas]